MLNYRTDYGSQGLDKKDPHYPYGKALDADPIKGKRGFPLKAAFANDLLGAFQALLKAAGIKPSGKVETAQESDLLKAVRQGASNQLKQGELLTVDEQGQITSSGKPVRQLASTQLTQGELLTVDEQGQITSSGKPVRQLASNQLTQGELLTVDEQGQITSSGKPVRQLASNQLTQGELLTVDEQGQITSSGKPVRQLASTQLKQGELLTVDEQGQITSSGKTIRQVQIEAIAIGTRLLRLPGDLQPGERYGGLWKRLDGFEESFLRIKKDASGWPQQSAGLPNITGDLKVDADYNGKTYQGGSGCFVNPTGQQGSSSEFTISTAEWGGWHYMFFRASSSNSIYGRSRTVLPKHHCVELWEKTAHEAKGA